MKLYLKRFLMVSSVLLFLSLSEPAFAQSGGSTNEDINSNLLEKGFTQEEINNMLDTTKRKIASKPGKKAKYKVEVSEYFTNSDGKKIKVTSENKKQIRKEMKQEIVKYSAENNVSILRLPQPVELENNNVLSSGEDSYNDSKLGVYAFVYHYGTSSTNYHYATNIDFSWSKIPTYARTDSIALAWDHKWIGEANSLTKSYHMTENYTDKTSSMKTSQSLYGYSAKFPLQYTTPIMGGVGQDVTVPISQRGQKGKFQGKYVHTIVPFTGSVTIGPGSIDVPLDWVNQEFVLDFNVQVGS